MNRSTTAPAAAALMAAALVGLCAAARADSFDYLYIEANEGSSSGGHAAIRFGDRTFHFQNQDGLLVVDRKTTSDFFHDYALIDNRTIHASRVEVDSADRQRIRARFDRRYYVQSRQLDVLEALREDHALLERWQRTAQGDEPEEAAPDIPGLGYFAGFRSDCESPARSARVRDLREQIEQRHGARFLAERRDTAHARLSSLASADPAGWRIRELANSDDDPAFEAPWSRSYRDTAASLAAIEVLEAAAPLARDALVVPEGSGYWLEPDEIRSLRHTTRSLAEQLVRLASSPRPDWGRPFLVGLARLLALDESLAQRRWVFVDVIPDDARRLAYRHLAPRLDILAEMALFGRHQIEAARALWASQAGGAQTDVNPERAWGRFEEAANRVHELSRALRERSDLRLARGKRLPARSGRLASSLPRATDAREIEASLQRVAARQGETEKALSDLYRYHLITRNCVSELFHTINDAMGHSAAASQQVLGGHIDGTSSLTFVPFVSASAVDARYRVVERFVLPSYRELRLSEMRDRESRWWVALRESNTLTAKSYRRGHRDSFFVFFTDETVALRPIFGAVNLTAAVGESLWGLVRLPIDQGETLASGLEGALLSLPELAFFNIRKGTNDWVQPRESDQYSVRETNEHSVRKTNEHSVRKTNEHSVRKKDEHNVRKKDEHNVGERTRPVGATTLRLVDVDR